jgi:Cdc6-like AAA superfamily ATPase
MRSTIRFFGLNRKELYSVFTPTHSATITYVERPSLDTKVKRAITKPGTQLIVYGLSGSGKTTLVRQALIREKRNFIITNCLSTSTLDDLKIDALDNLNPYYASKKTTKHTSKITSTLKSSYAGFSSTIKGESLIESGQESQRVLPVQLSFNKLAEFLNAANCIWVIDDFHKVDSTQKGRLAEVMKAFADYSNDYKNVKIIAIGAVNSAREVVNYGNDLKPRLSETLVPLLTFEELKKILLNGSELLNVKFSDKLIKATAEYSNSLGSICHELAYNLCDLSNVTKTCRRKVEISDSLISTAIKEYVKDRADTYQEKLDKALKQKKRKYNNVEIILNAIITLNKDEVTYNEILTKIQEEYPDYPQGNCTAYLKFLINEEISIIRFDSNSGRYSFSDPFFKAYCKMAFRDIEEERQSDFSLQSFQRFFETIRQQFNISVEEIGSQIHTIKVMDEPLECDISENKE